MTPCVAITGASGFIGQRLVRQFLSQDLRLRCLVRQPPGTQSDPKLCPVYGSLEDEESLAELVQDAEVVVHCAGLIKSTDPEAFQRVNRDGTKRLAQVCAQAKSRKRLIVLSSLAAREPQLSAYGASKRAAEEALAAFSEEVDWVILRPPAVYGPGDRETWQFFRFLNWRIMLLPGVKSARFALIYVNDLCNAIGALRSEKSVSKAILNVHDGHRGGYGWHDVVRETEHCLGTSLAHVPLPRMVLHGLALSQGIAHRFWGREPDLTIDKVNELYWKDWTSSENKLTTLSKWRPKYQLKEGLRETLQWYRDNRWL